MIRIQIKSISFFILVLMQVTCSKNMRQQQNASKPDGPTVAQLPVSDTKVQAVPVQAAAESAVVAELRQELERLQEQHTADVQALAALKQQCGQARSVDAGETMNRGVRTGENPASIVSSHPTLLAKLVELRNAHLQSHQNWEQCLHRSTTHNQPVASCKIEIKKIIDKNRLSKLIEDLEYIYLQMNTDTKFRINQIINENGELHDIVVSYSAMLILFKYPEAKMDFMLTMTLRMLKQVERRLNAVLSESVPNSTDVPTKQTRLQLEKMWRDILPSVKNP